MLTNISKIIINLMSKELKNYYEILEIPFDASTFDIEKAYQKLASQWHPDKHKTDRRLAEKKFHDVSEAYDVLSDRNSRAHYDELLQKKYNSQDAHSTFERFFQENGMIDEEQEKFFNTHYSDRVGTNYYAVLGVSRDATLDEIKKAYRKQALKYHPKNNPNNAEAEKKFVEINEAYNALSNQQRRQTYDNWLFGEIAPYRAHNIFDDFFGRRLIEFPEQDEIFKPILTKSWSKNLDKLMDQSNWDNVKDGETWKTQTVFSRDKNGQSKKTVTTKKQIKDGKAIESKTEQYLFPNGNREITYTTNSDGRIETKKYHLGPGQQAPKELTN